jgi:hypothetical protein
VIARIAALAAICAASVVFPALGNATVTRSPRLRVLFVGNSYTRFNNLPRMLHKLAEADPSGPAIETALSARGGRQLRGHVRAGEAFRRLDAVRPTHVVLQPHSMEPLSYPDRTAEYVHRFRDETVRHGSELVLFETWARSPGHRLYRRGDHGRSPEEMQARIDRILTPLAASLQLRIAPIGRACLRVLARNDPNIRLHRRDGSHPTEAGTYLAACVLYKTLTGRSPRGVGYRPYPMTRRTAAELQDAADAAALPQASY